MKEQSFEEYMKYFKSQSLKDKQNIVFEQLKMLASFTNNMCNQLNTKNEILLDKELADLNKENYTEDDFAEAMIVLINSIQNSLCDFSLKLTDIMDFVTEKTTEQ